jgi:hypothetical protein
MTACYNIISYHKLRLAPKGCVHYKFFSTSYNCVHCGLFLVFSASWCHIAMIKTTSIISCWKLCKHKINNYWEFAIADITPGMKQSSWEHHYHFEDMPSCPGTFPKWPFTKWRFQLNAVFFFLTAAIFDAVWHG